MARVEIGFPQTREAWAERYAGLAITAPPLVWRLPPVGAAPDAGDPDQLTPR